MQPYACMWQAGQVAVVVWCGKTVGVQENLQECLLLANAARLDVAIGIRILAFSIPIALVLFPEQFFLAKVS